MNLEKILNSQKTLKYFLLPIVSIVLLFLLKDFVIFLMLCIACGVIVFLNYFIKFPFDFTPIFFLSFIITLTYGYGFFVLFVVLAGFVPTIISAGEIDIDYFVFMALLFLLNIIPSLMNDYNMLIGVVLVTTYSIIGGLISIGLGKSPSKQIISILFIIFVNVFYFLEIGPILINLII